MKRIVVGEAVGLLNASVSSVRAIIFNNKLGMTGLRGGLDGFQEL
jgi:hypothetical protein